MSGNTSLFMIIIGAALVNNVVLSQFLGICSFLGVSSLESALSSAFPIRSRRLLPSAARSSSSSRLLPR